MFVCSKNHAEVVLKGDETEDCWVCKLVEDNERLDHATRRMEAELFEQDLAEDKAEAKRQSMTAYMSRH